MDYLVSAGQLDKGQTDGSYDGTPANFVAAGGKDAQQGFASAEPYIYENGAEGLGQARRLPADPRRRLDRLRRSRWRSRPDNSTKYWDCFKKLVPIIQQSPGRLHQRPGRGQRAHPRRSSTQYNNGWVYSQGIAEYSVDSPSSNTASWATAPTARWATSTRPV